MQIRDFACPKTSISEEPRISTDSAAQSAQVCRFVSDKATMRPAPSSFRGGNVNPADRIIERMEDKWTN